MTQSSASLKGFRASILDFIADPFYKSEAESVRYFADGLLVVENGTIKEVGDYKTLQTNYSTIPITAYTGKLIMPGLIDMHIHFPQTEMIWSYGKQLLDWLNDYTFPIERKFANKAYADRVADIFLNELVRNGTTTAVVLAAVFPASVDAFFEAAERRNMRMIAGKVMMDRHAPDFLLDTAESSYTDSKLLIEKWHGKGRSLYAVTPRFAPTSTHQQLQYAGQLLAEFPGIYLHTHISENVQEVAWVKELFPDSKGYLDVYDQFGLVGDRSIFAHCVQLTDAEFDRLAEAQSAIAFCPTSNLFLGSGLFKIEQAKAIAKPIKLGLATDVGGGTSFSMLQTANEAYKVAQLRHQTLSPFQALFLATLGSAQALNLDSLLGNFEVGKEADFIVLDFQATPLLAFRNPETTPETLKMLSDLVFSVLMMGDDRAIHATYIMGDRVQAFAGKNIP
jgi:guanine deaminase